MRTVSIGVLFHESFLTADVVKCVESHFSNYLGDNYRLIHPRGSNNILIFWDNVTIGDNFNVNHVVLDVTDSLPNAYIFFNELGDPPSFWKRWGPTIIGASIGILGIAVSVTIASGQST